MRDVLANDAAHRGGPGGRRELRVRDSPGLPRGVGAVGALLRRRDARGRRRAARRGRSNLARGFSTARESRRCAAGCAREQGAQRGTDWHAHDTLDAPPDTDVQTPISLRRQRSSSPVDGRRLKHVSMLQFTSPGRARTRPRWRSAAQPRSSRASRAPPRTRGSPPPPSTRDTCPAAWRGSERGSPCRPSDPRTMRGTPRTPTSGLRWVSSASVATGASGLLAHPRREHRRRPERTRVRSRRIRPRGVSRSLPGQTLILLAPSVVSPRLTSSDLALRFRPSRLPCRRRWR